MAEPTAKPSSLERSSLERSSLKRSSLKRMILILLDHLISIFL